MIFFWGGGGVWVLGGKGEGANALLVWFTVFMIRSGGRLGRRFEVLSFGGGEEINAWRIFFSGLGIWGWVRQRIG